jgi:hypothetical protein
MGCGKSSIASLVSIAENVPVLCPDDFATPEPTSGNLSGRIDLKQLHASARKLLKQSCVFEGVCLEELLPSASFGGGFIVYLKRVSLVAGGSPVWQDEKELNARERAANPIDEEVRRYHRTCRPHEHADLCLAVPEGCD